MRSKIGTVFLIWRNKIICDVAEQPVEFVDGRQAVDFARKMKFSEYRIVTNLDGYGEKFVCDIPDGSTLEQAWAVYAARTGVYTKADPDVMKFIKTTFITGMISAYMDVHQFITTGPKPESNQGAINMLAALDEKLNDLCEQADKFEQSLGVDPEAN